MIFYFSGTGSTAHAAKRAAEKTGERTVFINEKELSEKKIYSLQKDERIGFAFPVYWYGLPTIVQKFINNLELGGFCEQYVYALVTYGIDAGGVMNRLQKALEPKRLKLSGKFGVKAVDNYVVGYDVPPKEKQLGLLKQMDSELDIVLEMVDKKEKAEHYLKGCKAFITPVISAAYGCANHTKKFFADSKCVSCGKCAAECPCGAIKMQNGKPVWNGSCTFCLHCINSCPKEAVQYGKGTEKRGRYMYPAEKS